MKQCNMKYSMFMEWCLIYKDKEFRHISTICISLYLWSIWPAKINLSPKQTLYIYSQIWNEGIWESFLMITYYFFVPSTGWYHGLFRKNKELFGFIVFIEIHDQKVKFLLVMWYEYTPVFCSVAPYFYDTFMHKYFFQPQPTYLCCRYIKYNLYFISIFIIYMKFSARKSTK